MLDDRNTTSNEFTGRLFLWTHADNRKSWNLLLGGKAGSPDIPVTSAAGRMTLEQAEGLPSTYLNIGERDIFRDESIEYCAKLARAGVSIELHAVPGLGHGFDGFRGKPAVKAVVEARYRAIRSI
jgi:acetyl esterase/lipase